MAREFSFKISFDDFDLSLLADPDLDCSSNHFGARVTAFFANQFEGFGGRARVIVNDQARQIEVHWTKEGRWKDPKEKTLDLLNQGKLTDALPLIWTLVQQNPDDADNLYHLGVVYSELRQFGKATAVLQRLIEIAPDHVHGLTALGVAEIASGNLMIAEQWLSKAARIDPGNRWALRNLGACLMKQHRFEEASKVLRRCLAEAPKDIAAMIGLGEALQEMGDKTDADELYKLAITTGGPQHILDIAKDRRTKIAESKFRSTGNLRTDAVVYIKDALDRFDKMSSKQIQDLGLEIGILGMKGLSINDPTKKYPLKSVSGDFTGLQLVSIMYAAFQQFAPGQDVGIDLSAEYAAAVSERK